VKSKKVLEKVPRSPGGSPKNLGESPKIFEKAQQDCVERPNEIV
jgi:hypothetical protein